MRHLPAVMPPFPVWMVTAGMSLAVSVYVSDGLGKLAGDEALGGR
jgi:hypothetical protein